MSGHVVSGALSWYGVMHMQLGVVGLGTMGANLARNAARNGARVAVFNRTTSKMEEFLSRYGKGGDMHGAKTLSGFCPLLKTPRPILLMVKAGEAVSEMIEELLPHLSKGDILIDGGNSHYRDTERRASALSERGIRYLGMGVSGGEEGALRGPSLMPGGDESAYRELEPLLTAMAASDGVSGKCVAYLGPRGAGHFVKMVHNGIEYGLMQLIAEIYDVLRNAGGYTNAELAETFEHWNAGEDLQSFLIEITAAIFRKRDESARCDLIDVISDRAGQKGTGKWTIEAGDDLGVPIPTIAAAVSARILSGSSELRRDRRGLPFRPDLEEPVPPRERLRSITRSTLHLSMLTAYAQGFELLRAASGVNGWNLDLTEVARIWRGGCIIRSALLPHFQNSFGSGIGRRDTAKQVFLQQLSSEKQVHWRLCLELCVSSGIPAPAISASLAYYDSLRRERLPQNLIQAQRDYFGAHTYERLDRHGSFHTEWKTA